MVAADEARVEQLRPIAQDIIQHSGMAVRLLRFSKERDRGGVMAGDVKIGWIAVLAGLGAIVLTFWAILIETSAG